MTERTLESEMPTGKPLRMKVPISEAGKAAIFFISPIQDMMRSKESKLNWARCSGASVNANELLWQSWNRCKGRRAETITLRATYSKQVLRGRPVCRMRPRRSLSNAFRTVITHNDTSGV